MIMTAAATDSLSSLLLMWVSTFVHDLRTSCSVASGFAKLLAAEADDDRRTRMRQEQERAFARLGAMISAAGTCSRVGGGTLADLVRLVEFVIGERLSVTKTGDMAVRAPHPQLGFILWLLGMSQRRSSDSVSMEVTVTNWIIRIRIGPTQLNEPESWIAIDSATADRWWFVDALEYLRASGCRIDARYKGDDWDVVLTWNRLV
jgi:hypothetical protein